jgi:putative hydrolase of the HAD superfamily
MTMLKCLVFDLDETIYPRQSGLMQAISERISAYMVERLRMDPQVVPHLRRAYWEEYGTTSRGLQLLHGIDVDDYMHFVHDIPLADYIGPDPVLNAALSGLSQRKVIFTNATADHARAVLEIVGVGQHFEAIYDAYFAENESKPAPGAYRRLLRAIGLPGRACLMVEDSARNLRPAKSLGMVTVLVDPPSPTETDGADYVIAKAAEIGDVVRRVEVEHGRSEST